jgi:hypothetical protein
VAELGDGLVLAVVQERWRPDVSRKRRKTPWSRERRGPILPSACGVGGHAAAARSQGISLRLIVNSRDDRIDELVLDPLLLLVPWDSTREASSRAA